MAPDGAMMAVPVALAGAAPGVELPVPLFQTHLATGTVLGEVARHALAASEDNVDAG